MPDPSADPGVAVTSTLYHGCAIVDHTTRSLAPEMAVLVADGRVGWLGPAEEAPIPTLEPSATTKPSVTSTGSATPTAEPSATSSASRNAGPDCASSSAAPTTAATRGR